MHKTFALLTLLALGGLTACKKEAVTEYDCTGDTPTYTADVLPILENSCAIIGCHNFGSAQGGVSLADYDDTKAAASGELSLMPAESQTRSHIGTTSRTSALPVAAIQLLR